MKLEVITRDPKGSIKPLLILLSIITFSTPASYTSKCPTESLPDNKLTLDSFDHQGFFVAVFVLLFLFETVLLGLYLYMMDFLKSLAYNWWLLEFIYTVIWGFFCLLSSCLFSDGITHVENFYKDHGNSDCGYAGWKFGVAVGIITFLLMGVKGYYLYVELSRTRDYSAFPDNENLSPDLESAEEVTVTV